MGWSGEVKVSWQRWSNTNPGTVGAGSERGQKGGQRLRATALNISFTLSGNFEILVAVLTQSIDGRML